MSIAKEIVERHEGRIEVESEGVPGKGTTFTIWLPVEPESDDQQPALDNKPADTSVMPGD